MAHELTICTRDVKSTQYVGKSYKSRFDCPICGRNCWQNLNFLGTRNVVCDGEKFTKIEKERTLLHGRFSSYKDVVARPKTSSSGDRK